MGLLEILKERNLDAAKVAMIGLIWNATFLLFEFICLVTTTWVTFTTKAVSYSSSSSSGPFDCHAGLSAVYCGDNDDETKYTADGIADDCKTAVEGAAFAMAIAWLMYIVCLTISILFIFGDRLPTCECLNKPGAERIMTFVALGCALGGSLMSLIGWGAYVTNVVNNDSSSGEGGCGYSNKDQYENTIGGASLGFWALFWFLRLPFPIVFYAGADVFNPKEDDKPQASELQEPTADGAAPPITVEDGDDNDECQDDTPAKEESQDTAVRA